MFILHCRRWDSGGVLCSALDSKLCDFRISLFHHVQFQSLVLYGQPIYKIPKHVFFSLSTVAFVTPIKSALTTFTIY